MTLAPGRAKFVNESLADRVDNLKKHDWDGVRSLHQRRHHWAGTSKDQIGILLNQFLRKGLYALCITGGPAIVDQNIATNHPTLVPQALHKRGDQSPRFLIAFGKGHKHADPPRPL